MQRRVEKSGIKYLGCEGGNRDSKKSARTLTRRRGEGGHNKPETPGCCDISKDSADILPVSHNRRALQKLQETAKQKKLGWQSCSYLIIFSKLQLNIFVLE